MTTDFTKSPYVYKKELDEKVRLTESQLYSEKNKKENSISKKRMKMFDLDFDCIGGMISRRFLILAIALPILGVIFLGSLMIKVPLIIAAILSPILVLVKYVIIKINNKNIDQEKKRLDEKLKEDIADTRKRAENEYKEYCPKFEQTAKSLSVTFVGSQMLGKVIDSAQVQLDQMMKNADRRPHIHYVTVKFPIKVMFDKITLGNSDVFDFEIECCKNIETYIDQAAIANALASELRTYIMEKASADRSLNPFADIKFDYSDREVIVNLDYQEENPAFVQAQAF